MTEPTIIQEQERREAWDPFLSFPRETSDVPAEWLTELLNLSYAEIHREFNIILEVCGTSDHGDARDSLQALNPKRSGAMILEIWDIARDGRVIIGWTACEGRAGGGNFRMLACTTMACTPEQIRWIKGRWERAYRRNAQMRAFNVAFVQALKRAHMDNLSIGRRRQRVLRQEKLDDDSVAARRQEIRQRVMLEFPELKDAPKS